MLHLKKEDEEKLREELKNKNIICKEIGELYCICDIIRNKYNIPCKNLKREDSIVKKYIIFYNNYTKKFQYESFGNFLNINTEKYFLWAVFSEENAMLMCDKLNEYNINLIVESLDSIENLIIYKTIIN